jgi:hypothetical protein
MRRANHQMSKAGWTFDYDISFLPFEGVPRGKSRGKPKINELIRGSGRGGGRGHDGLLFFSYSLSCARGLVIGRAG